MRCPNCDREMVDTVSSSDAKGDTYGCPRCHTLFTAAWKLKQEGFLFETYHEKDHVLVARRIK